MNKEKIHKIIDLCLDAKERGCDCFLRYSGHVDRLDVDVYLFGWSSGTEPDCKRDIKLTYPNVHEKLDEVIVFLEDVINTEDRAVKINNFQRKFDSIMMEWYDTNIRDLELSKLLTKIELAFSIPAFKDKAFNMENPDVMELYQNVSNERSFIKALKD